MIIRETPAAGGGAGAMSAPSERSAKQVRQSNSIYICVCVCIELNLCDNLHCPFLRDSNDAFLSANKKWSEICMN